MKKIIAAFCLMSIFSTAQANELTTCYAGIFSPKTTQNAEKIVRSIPSLGVTGTWSRNLGIVLSILKYEKNGILIKDNAAVPVNEFVIKLEGTEVNNSYVENKTAIKSSLKVALEQMRKQTPSSDQKYLSIFLNGCTTSTATDMGSID